jgi:hypothetical protein
LPKVLGRLLSTNLHVLLGADDVSG